MITTPELAALVVVMTSALLVIAVLGSARLGLIARTEHIARSFGARVFG